MLKTRLLSTLKDRSPAESAHFKDAPIIVTRKFLRDALNESKAKNFASESNQQFEIYHARDKIAGKSVSSEQQRRLWKLGASDTGDSIGKLPLIPGMPVMITENAATSAHIVNGSRGILKSITYDSDADGNKFAVCALVHIPESALDVPGLSDGTVPILPVTSSFVFPTNTKKINVRRTQLPILPGWAFTDFKIQGSTMTKVVVDLTGAKTLQSIYVMLSRVSCLRDVAILRWFSSRTLYGSLQGDAREEMQWLRRVATWTREKYLVQHENDGDNVDHERTN
ncbi:uncharacterized protein F5891DRAFT_968729 [Suillus fuscotomentosus]|uniref:Uncharacterized protein n=1 Tax=Suillus fuscotomentosus TaxID=1912939 RepID=A0AAD4DNJ7_9AGAM|nr:uncharacterized protein F5891DRAFT_968729 [Suillus fuscotomentosus]KAG1886351.1 hypothetical protein F5891DRAFT_968729 [Suillus fuscotomentosus]